MPVYCKGCDIIMSVEGNDLVVTSGTLVSKITLSPEKAALIAGILNQDRSINQEHLC